MNLASVLNLADDPDIDPEVRPGLFQGDIAMDNDIYQYWRVGLKWEVFPEKLWKNGTVPYVISPLYGMCIMYNIYSDNFQTYNFLFYFRSVRLCYNLQSNSYIKFHDMPKICAVEWKN